VLILPLPNGGCIALDAAALEAARHKAADMGFGPTATAPCAASTEERWLTSEELAGLTGVGSTTWEGLAKAGKVRHLRIGKALRFLESEAREDMRA
jgi:excisionase family DNA binding protein